MTLRILAVLVLLLSVLFAPFWLSVILCLAAIAYFHFFWEGVALFFLSDLLYGIGEARFFNVYFVSSITAFLVLIIIETLKKKMRISK